MTWAICRLARGCCVRLLQHLAARRQARAYRVVTRFLIVHAQREAAWRKELTARFAYARAATCWVRAKTPHDAYFAGEHLRRRRAGLAFKQRALRAADTHVADYLRRYAVAKACQILLAAPAAARAT